MCPIFRFYPGSPAPLLGGRKTRGMKSLWRLGVRPSAKRHRVKHRKSLVAPPATGGALLRPLGDLLEGPHLDLSFAEMPFLTRESALVDKNQIAGPSPKKLSLLGFKYHLSFFQPVSQEKGAPKWPAHLDLSFLVCLFPV